MKTSFLTSAVVLSLATALAAPVEYFDQSAFGNNAGQLTIEGFETLPNGAPLPNGATLSGTEFQSKGFTFRARRITVVTAASVGLSDLNINSQPNGISAALYYSSPGTAAFDNGNDDFDFTLATPARAAGLWIGNLGARTGDLNPTHVTFYDQDGNRITGQSLDQANPHIISSEHNNRLFYGVVSDIPIKTVAVENGAGDQDAIILDDFQFVPADPCPPTPNFPPFAPPVPGKIISDFGPRDLDGQQGTYFHPGIDYRADVGTPVAAVEAGNIEEIGNDTTRGKRGGWFVRIRGLVPPAGQPNANTWSYLHLFSDVDPYDLAGVVVLAEAGDFAIGVRPDGRGYCIVRFSGLNQVDKVFVPLSAGQPPPTILGLASQPCVAHREAFAASGNSGRVPAHLHLALNGGAANPLSHVAHQPSAFAMKIFEPAPGSQFRLHTKIDINVIVDSTVGLDLNAVDMSIRPIGATTGIRLTPIQGRPAFEYGGGPNEGEPSKSVSEPNGHHATILINGTPNHGTTFKLTPLVDIPGLDRFTVTGIKAVNFGPGNYELHVRAISLSGLVFVATETFQILPR